MHKTFLIFGAFSGLLSILLGAFGAHALQEVITDEKLLHGFQTGVQYQMYHALALLVLGLLYEKFPVKLLRWSGILFISGIILFSGSLYLLTLLNGKSEALLKFIGPITPVGGTLFIIGWIFLLMAILKKRDSVR
ncbi:MAG: DUF423 domain-containing protein [Bacteroidetes bacterium]|nr:DUF423 domain-containing protein [Bacteroidota bacterium]MBS1930443.1 DUF423 domain-containing protein [Bacteroidota bacterium]